MISPKLRHRWYALAPRARLTLLERLSATPRDIERLLTDERIFMTTPIEDRRLLEHALGFASSDNWLVRSSGEARTAPAISLVDAERTAAELLAELGLRSAPPINVEAVASRMGADVAFARIPSDGRLSYRDGRMTVLVSTDASPVRQRFTIAHELGHMWLRDNRRVKAELSLRGEEHFCNRFAAALLMPRGWVASAASERGQGLESLTQLAREAETSKSAMLARLRGLQIWRLSLVRFNWDAGRWRLQGAAALPSNLRGRVTSAPDTGGVLQEAMRRGGTVDLPLPLATDGVSVHSYRAEIQARPKSAIALVDFVQRCDEPPPAATVPRAGRRSAEGVRERAVGDAKRRER